MNLKTARIPSCTIPSWQIFFKCLMNIPQKNHKVPLPDWPWLMPMVMRDHSSPRGMGDKGGPSSTTIPREVGTEKKIAFPQDYLHGFTSCGFTSDYIRVNACLALYYQRITAPGVLCSHVLNRAVLRMEEETSPKASISMYVWNQYEQDKDSFLRPGFCLPFKGLHCSYIF